MSSYVVVLLCFAQVAATLTGFIGVVFVFGERPHGQFDTHESSALFHLLFSALGALFLSLFAALMLVYSAANQHFAWRIANGISGSLHLIGAGRLTLEAWREASGMQRAFVASTIGLGTAGGQFCGRSRLSNPTGGAHLYARDALDARCHRHRICFPADFSTARPRNCL
jgi:hypothetical protein